MSLAILDAKQILVHMTTISIRKLHLKTGERVRQAARRQELIITERGAPVAILIPFEPTYAVPHFAARKLLPGVATLRALGHHDSTHFISADRDRA